MGPIRVREQPNAARDNQLVQGESRVGGDNGLLRSEHALEFVRWQEEGSSYIYSDFSKLKCANGYAERREASDEV